MCWALWKSGSIAVSKQRERIPDLRELNEASYTNQLEPNVCRDSFMLSVKKKIKKCITNISSWIKMMAIKERKHLFSLICPSGLCSFLSLKWFSEPSLGWFLPPSQRLFLVTSSDVSSLSPSPLPHTGPLFYTYCMLFPEHLSLSEVIVRLMWLLVSLSRSYQLLGLQYWMPSRYSIVTIATCRYGLNSCKKSMCINFSEVNVFAPYYLLKLSFFSLSHSSLCMDRAIC